ncbi:MAG: apolipoprotein N-acyltransferase [Alphaproteobacteria bacterium]
MQRFSDSIIVLWGWRRAVVALVAGALSALAFAPFHLFPILWITIPVLIWLLDGAAATNDDRLIARLAPAAWIGWLFGVGFFFAGMWWVGLAFLANGGLLVVLAPLAPLALAAVLATFWAFGAALARLAWSHGWSRILVFAVAMAVAEWLRGHLFGGLPWNAFGYALTPLPEMMQSASLVGLWGLTLAAFVIFATPAALAAASHEERRNGLSLTAVALVLLLAHTGFGVLWLAIDRPPPAPVINLRVVQPVIPQNERWGSEQTGDVMGRLIGLSSSGDLADAAPPLVVIWPESAFPFFLTENARALAAIADMLPPGGALVTGAARVGRPVADAQDRPVFNSVFVIDDIGEIRAAYDKVHLVPFGEYLPLDKWLRSLGLSQLVALPGGFTAGSVRRTLDLPNGTAIGPLVCYEAIFPGAVTERARRPQWLINVTNDGWFGTSAGVYQHFHQARLRTVETGLPLVRAANTGISAIIDGRGQVVASLPVGEMGVIDARLPPARAVPPYAIFGDWIFAVLLLLTLATALIYRRSAGEH